MGINDILDNALESHRQRKKEGFPWLLMFLVFAMLTLVASFVKSAMANNADYLGGKATVEKFFTANLVQLIIMLVLLVAFVVVLIKTWNGKSASMEQLIFTIGAGLLVILMSVKALLPVMSIAKELKSPRTIEVESYTLCTDSDGKYYVAFDDDGGVLLNIPLSKYSELQGGAPSSRLSGGQANRLVSEDDGYSNVQLYESKAKITYYNKSIIYESLSLLQT